MRLRTFSKSNFAERLMQVVLLIMAIVTFPGIASAAAAAETDEYVTAMASADRFALAGQQSAADIFVAEDDWKVARIASDNLALDVERVTGRKPKVKNDTSGLSPDAVLVGTIGKSAVIDDLIESGRLDVSDVKGLWESFVIATVKDPLPGVSRALVIAGSDRRGTAYGVFELSRRIGVSPWYWWADVTPKQRAELHVAKERLRVGPPAVKYRGMFINDEMWGIRPWAQGTIAPAEGKGLGPTTYAHVFELLLRLRGNYLWPAMHLHTTPFNYYPENKIVADDYAIVMGSSHIEPMLRNNMPGAEWDQEDGGKWDYSVSRDSIYEYWESAVKRNGRYENIYTIGMRGQDDEAMEGGDTEEEKIAMLEGIFKDQREILSKHVNPDPTKVPQVFIPYTEVLGLYDAGMKVPDDVIICWPDDNFGYIRRLPTAKERARSGGSGVYYHIQWLNGATSAYAWLNCTPPALIFAEMNKAWQYEARDLWILNVGDIKPGEIGTDFFFDMAWDPQKWRHDNIRQYLTEWARRDLDPRFAEEIAELMEEYYRLGFTRRPEHLVQYQTNTPLSFSWFSHNQYGDEASRRLADYAEIAKRAQAIYEKIPNERKDAFFQLVLYPVQCAALMNEKIICADSSMRDAAAGRSTARGYALRSRAAADRIIELTDHYNNGLLTAGDKWRYMMTWNPGPWGNQRHQYEMPPLSDYNGVGPPTLEVAPEGGDAGAVADLSVYTQGRRFIDLFNIGKNDIEWTAKASEPWLLLSATKGSFNNSQRLWLKIDWDKVPKGRDIEGAIEFASNGGNQQISVPIFNPASPNRDDVGGFIESHGYVSMEAEHFTHSEERDGAAWKVIGGLGRSGDSVEVFPTTLASRTDPAAIRAHSPSLEYDMYLFGSGDFELHLDCLPTRSIAPGSGVRLAISIDDAEPQVLEGQSVQQSSDVLSNLRRWTTTVKIVKPGQHKLTVWMVDPGVILDKIVLYTAKPKGSYLGPPESFRR